MNGPHGRHGALLNESARIIVWAHYVTANRKRLLARGPDREPVFEVR